MSELSLRMIDGTWIVVPSSLEAITTYVILEQEKWFEKEIAFLANWLRPGMTALDIGANLGVYSLLMARLVGPNGQVYAYEPGSEARRLLAKSKTLNSFENLHVDDAALSDSERDGRLVLGASSELNSLTGSGPGERVRITSLDAEQARGTWHDVDFIKIDAEGEEQRIIAGANRLFTERSPLIMFEVKAGATQNDSLSAAFAALGFGIYRLLSGAPALVPVAIGEPLDAYELNLFAVKPDLAASLSRDEHLVETIANWTPSETDRTNALTFLQSQPFGSIFAALPGGGAALDSNYRDALAGYAVWRSARLSLSERYAALRFACDGLTSLCQKQPTLPRLSSLARIAWEAGRRGVSVQALRLAADVLKRGDGRIMEPFWPANPRFDAILPGPNVVSWFVVALLEQLEFTASYSSLFAASGIDLDWLAKQPHVAAEIERRRILVRSRAGQKTLVPQRLVRSAADHINAAAWQNGLVPNTFVR